MKRVQQVMHLLQSIELAVAVEEIGLDGVMGPDLTGSNRTDVNYILMNVLGPEAEIQEDYKMVVISTRDGRTYTGNVIAEDQRSSERLLFPRLKSQAVYHQMLPDQLMFVFFLLTL